MKNRRMKLEKGAEKEGGFEPVFKGTSTRYPSTGQGEDSAKNSTRHLLGNLAKTWFCGLGGPGASFLKTI